MAETDLDLASLHILLQRVRRHPHDRTLRLAAAQDVAVLAAYEVQNLDKLLQDMISIAKMLRRALDRANCPAIAAGSDLAAVNAWIDRLQGLMLRAIAR